MAKQKEAPTRHVRVADDLAKKLGEIIDVEHGATSAGILDPLIRKAIEARHEANLPAIRRMRNARNAIKGSRAKLPSGGA